MPIYDVNIRGNRADYVYFEDPLLNWLETEPEALYSVIVAFQNSSATWNIKNRSREEAEAAYQYWATFGRHFNAKSVEFLSHRGLLHSYATVLASHNFF